MSTQFSIRSAQLTNSYGRVSSHPTCSIEPDFCIKEIIPIVCFRSQLPHFYLVSNTKSYKNIVRYPIYISKLRLLVNKNTLKDFMKMFGHSFFCSRLVIRTSFPIKPDSLLSSEKPFSTPGDKISFSVLKLSPGSSTADCSHPQLTE